jgi:hypothetical protein
MTNGSTLTVTIMPDGILLTDRPTNTEALVGDHMPIWLPDTVYQMTLARVWLPRGICAITVSKRSRSGQIQVAIRERAVITILVVSSDQPGGFMHEIMRCSRGTV